MPSFSGGKKKRGGKKTPFLWRQGIARGVYQKGGEGSLHVFKKRPVKEGGIFFQVLARLHSNYHEESGKKKKQLK